MNRNLWLREGFRVRSCDGTFTRQRLEPNKPLPRELCVSAAINNAATRAATSARRFTTLTPTTAKPGWRCWGSCASALTGWCIAIVWRAIPYHLLAQTPEVCRASSCSTRRTRQGSSLLRRLQRSFVFQPRLQAPVRRLPERLPGGRKIVLMNGGIVLMNGTIVLLHLAWYALSLARMRVRSGGFTHVLLQDLTPGLVTSDGLS